MGLRKNLVGERKEKEPKAFTEGTGRGRTKYEFVDARGERGRC